MPRVSRDWIAGGILLIVGTFLLAIEFFPEVAYLIPLLLGLVLIGLFLVVRSPGLLTAGGVITGVGVGILVARQGSQELGGAGVLASIGGGFLLVSVLATIFDARSARAWPIAPGLIFITLGAVMYAAGLGEEVLAIATKWWPIVLVAVGGYLLLAARLRLPLYADDEARHESPAAAQPLEETQPRPEPPTEQAGRVDAAD